MQEQETSATEYLFKLLPWFEANWKRFAYGAAVILVVIFVYSFYSYRQNQNEIGAGQTLTKAMVSNTGSALAEACLKIATDYSGTAAARRALLQGATTLFTVGKYPEAQTQFQKFLDAYPDNFLTPQAVLGVAASLDAQGKTDAAIGAYQKAAGQRTDINVVAAAKFALARIYETQGKSADAEKLYSDLARTYPNTSIAAEAGRRAMEMRIKGPATAATAAPAAAPAASTSSTAPFKLSH